MQLSNMSEKRLCDRCNQKRCNADRDDLPAEVWEEQSPLEALAPTGKNMSLCQSENECNPEGRADHIRNEIVCAKRYEYDEDYDIKDPSSA